MAEILKYVMEERLQGRRLTKDIDGKNEYLIKNGIKPDIVFMGDSITDNWNTEEAFKDFGVIVNNGIGGDKVGCMAERFACDVLQLQPKLCIFMGGINNIWTIDEFMKNGDFEGFGDECFKIIQTVKAAWLSIFEQARANKLNMLVCSITPLKGSYRKNLIYELNLQLRLLAKQYDVAYVDYYSSLSDENGILLDGITKDELHPNADGYVIMERVLREALK